MAYHPADDLDPRIAKLIRIKVKSITGNCGCGISDKTDISQHLSQKVVAALPKHDPTRASVVTFANTVINNAAVDLLTHATAQKRNRRREQPEESPTPVLDGAEARAKLELRLDVSEALKDLNSEELRIAELFMDGLRQAEIARQPGLSRQTVRRVEDRLAKLLKARGLA